MGKQRNTYNFSLSDIGGVDLGADPGIQKMRAEKAARQEEISPLLSTDAVTAPKVQALQNDAEVYKEYLSPGKFTGAAQDLDYQVAENQSATKQFINGLWRLVPMTASKFIGQIVATGQAVSYGLGNDDAFAESDITQGLASFDESVKSAMPIYATRAYDGKSLLEQMGTSKFWADDVGDGVAFLAAQVIGTKFMGAGLNTIGKGAAFLAKGTGAATLLESVPGAAKVANAIANNYSAVTAGIVNAGFSGALQAQDTRSQITQKLEGKVNPSTGLQYTPEEIKDVASAHAADTFNATFLTHIAPAIWESKIILGLSKSKLADLHATVVDAVDRKGLTTWENIYEGISESVLQKNVGKEALKGAVKGAAIEGLWEENIEQSIQNFDVKAGLNDKNVGVGDRTLNYLSGLLTNLGTKEGQKAVVLGMILGAPMGAVESASQARDQNSKMGDWLNGLRKSDSMYNADIKSLYLKHQEDGTNHKKGDLVLGEDGNPVRDLEAHGKLLMQIANNKELFDRQMVSMLTGNSDMAKLNENMALSAAVYREMETGRLENAGDDALTFLKWRTKKSIEERAKVEEKDKDVDTATKAVADANTPDGKEGELESDIVASKSKAEISQFDAKGRADIAKTVNQSLQKIDNMSDAYKKSVALANGLVKANQKGKRAAFNKVVEKGLFYEEIKRQSIDDMVQDRQALISDPLADQKKLSDEILKLAAMKADSIEKSKQYLYNTDEVFNAWEVPQTVVESAAEVLLDKKATERQKSTAMYTMDEVIANEGLRKELNNTELGVRMSDQNEEAITENISDRVESPIGNRNKFFYQAALDQTRMQTLTDKIAAYRRGEIPLKDVLGYAKENISHLDYMTAQKLSALTEEEAGKVVALQEDLDNTPEYLEPEDEEDLVGPINEDYIQKNIELSDKIEDLKNAREVLAQKTEESALDKINNKSKNVDDYLKELYAREYFVKGNHVIDTALNPDGSVKDDYFDPGNMVQRAIDDLTRVRDAFEDRNDVQNLKHIVIEANDLLTRLYKIRDIVNANKADREKRQQSIGFEEASLVVSQIKANPILFQYIDSVLNGTFDKAIQDILGLAAYHYEALSALLAKVKSLAGPSQISKIRDIIASRQDAISAEVMSRSKRETPINREFGSNPRAVFMDVWSNMAQVTKYPRVSQNKGGLYSNFKRTDDLADLKKQVQALPDDTTQLGMPKEDFISLLNLYENALGFNKLLSLLNVDVKDVATSEIKMAETEQFAPTAQQEIAIREGISWISGKDRHAFLRGIAGTGKTNVVLRWILDNSKTDKSRILSTALTKTASEVLGKATGTKTIPFNEIKPEDLSDIDMVIVDEYATIPSNVLWNFMSNKVRILLLGDPTQITPRLSSSDDVTNVVTYSTAAQIHVINPLTVVYRSDVSAVNEASDVFQDNNQPVTLLSVRANKDISQALALGVHTTTDRSQIEAVLKRNIAADPNRTRAIIVGTPGAVEDYQGLGADVMTVYDAQSKTYDEVYVDMESKNFGDDPQAFNTAMYTALSRAKKYALTIFNGTGKNIVDASLSTEGVTNDDKSREAKSNYIKAKTFELSMIDGLNSGKTVKETAKTSKPDVADAGEDAIIKEAEITETTDENVEIIASAPSESEALEDNIDPEFMGAVDTDSEESVETLTEIPAYMESPEVVDYVDGEAYKAIKRGDIGIGSGVLYIHHKNVSGEDTVTQIAQTKDGKWVKIGVIFGGMLSNPKYEDLRSGLTSDNQMPNLLNMDILNGSRTNGEPYTKADLQKFVVGEGTIGMANYLKFLYEGINKASKTVAKDLEDIFARRFFYNSEIDRSKNIKFKIFTDTEVGGRGWTHDFKPVPGIPYAVVGANNTKNYQGAKFVRLQANAIEKTSPQVVLLKTLADSIEEMEKITGLVMGDKNYNDVIRIFRNSLKIVEDKKNSPEGVITVARVELEPDFDESAYDIARREYFIADKRNPDKQPDFLRLLSEEKRQNAIQAVQKVAMQLYGVKKEEGRFTQEEIDLMGADYEAVEPKTKKTNKEGKPVFYAKLKSSPKKHDYEKVYRLSTSNSKTQIALDQIARANEYVGNQRIRVQQYTSGSNRKKSYKAKSLIAATGGNTKLYEMMKIAAAYMLDNTQNYTESEKMDAVRTWVEDNNLLGTQEGAIQTLYNQMSMIEGEEGQEVREKMDEAMAKKETSNLSLNTLKTITADENYVDGKHLTQNKYKFKNRSGANVTKQTYIRKPLMIDEFNDLGDSPFDNAEALGNLVHTTFSGILPTAITVEKLSKVTPESTESTKPLPTAAKEVPLLEEEQVTSTRIDEILDLMDKTDSFDELSKLNDKLKQLKARRAFDSEVNTDRGSIIRLSDAMADIKKMLPAITQDQIQFLNTAAIQRLSKPGEKLLGLFADHTLFLRSENDTVYDKVVRHEVMHAIYNDYLSDREKKQLRSSLDPTYALTEEQFDEHLANLFMNWQEGPRELGLGKFVDRIFKKILSWFNLYSQNKDIVEEVFQKIEAGKYTTPLQGAIPVRRAFSEIEKNYGNVKTYRDAVDRMQSVIKRSVMNSSLISSPLTMSESKEYVRQTLVKELEQYQREARVAKKLQFLATTEAEATKAFDDLEKITTDMNTLSKLFPLKSDGTLSNKVFNSLWKDQYPSFKFEDGDIVSSFEEEEGYLPTDEALASDIETPSNDIQELTLQADEKNNESKTTEGVKNFLSFIYRPSGVRVNPRFAYLVCLKTLNSLVAGEGNLVDQIRSAAEFLNINLGASGTMSDASYVVQKVISTYETATSEDYIDNRKEHIKLLPNARFFGDNKFVYSENALSDYSARVVSQITKNDKVIDRLSGESTPAFVARVSRESKLSKEHIIGYFKQNQAQETIRELMSIMLSQREASPLIAEEARIGDIGQQSTILRYFNAQFYGAERAIAGDIEKAISSKFQKIPQDTWSYATQQSEDGKKASLVDRVQSLLKAMGLKKDKSQINDINANEVLNNLIAFKNVVSDAYKDGLKVIENDEGYLGESEDIRYKDIEYLLSQDKSIVNNILSLLSTGGDDGRPAKYTSTDGTTRYSFHNSSQALETMQRVVNVTSNFIKKATLPKHLTTVWAKFNPFVEGKLNTIHRIIDHDGQRREGGEEFGKGYSDENIMENLKRQFSYGFLSYIKGNTLKSSDKVKYIQYFYTISNRPRLLGSEVNLLKPKELRESMGRMLSQLLSQDSSHPVKNYSIYKTTNAEELGDAIKSVVGELNSDTYAKLQADSNLFNAVLDKFEANLKELSKRVASTLVANDVPIGDDVASTVRLLNEGKRGYISKDAKIPNLVGREVGVLGYTEEDVLAIAELWVANNYVNSYFMNQLVTGNYNYFKNAEDLVKRMSGVFAPGIKPFSDSLNKFFAPKTFKVSISNDPIMLADEISKVFIEKDTALYKDWKDGKPVEIADAQGFMLPSRADELVAGLGQSYGAGAIFKAAHYEITKDGVPVMIKYSSAVLTDDLVNKYPKLKKEKEAMIEAGVSEKIYITGNKVGVPLSAAETPTIFEEAKAFKINEESVIELSNENYRLQLNPNHATDSAVSIFTQLAYFVNVLGKVNPEAGVVNDAAATEIYTAISNLVEHGSKKIDKKLDSKGRVTVEELKKTLTGAGNERIAEMLEHLSYNMPNIVDKALIQLMNMFAKSTVKIKFKGAKFTLQSAYGFEMIKPGSNRYNRLSDGDKAAHDLNWSAYGEKARTGQKTESRLLEYRTDENGRLYAEVLIDKSFADKAKIGAFLMPDMMSYRVPSTELHSAITLKVAGYYDSRGSNVIVAPPELVKQHGSDFDVDALYVVHRESFGKGLELFGIVDGTPPGYFLNEVGKYVFDKTGTEVKIAQMYSDAGTDATKINEVDRFYEMFQRNIIVENFIDVISNPVNIQRIAEPISTQVISDAIDLLGLDSKRRIDLSNPLDNLVMFNSNFQGLKLVGTFANAVKSLAYMLKSGNRFGRIDNILNHNKNSEHLQSYVPIWETNPALMDIGSKEEFRLFYERTHFMLGGPEKEFNEIYTSGDSLEDLNANKLTSITNKAEIANRFQKYQDIRKKQTVSNYTYPKLLISTSEDRTVKIVDKEYSQFVEKPKEGKTIWQVLDALINTSVDNVKDQLLYKINATNSTGNIYAAALAIGMEFKDAVITMLQPISLKHTEVGKDLDGVYSSVLGHINSKMPDGEQYKIFSDIKETKVPSENQMRSMMNRTLEELSLSELLLQAGLLKEYAKLSDLGTDISTFSSAVGIMQDMPVLYEDIEKKQEYWNKIGTVDADNNFTPNPNFGFQVTNLFKRQPNIAAAYKVFQRAKEVAQMSFMKHSPQIDLFVDEIIQSSRIKMSYKNNKKLIKNEVVSYLVSSFYGEETRNEPPFHYLYNKKPKVLTNKFAWSQRFVESIEAAKKDSDNKFLKKLSVSTSYGLKRLEFSMSSNADYTDNLEMQEAFEAITDPQLKRDLVKYAVLNYGLKFGVRNYSMYIPTQYLKPIDDYIRKIDTRVRKATFAQNVEGNKVLDSGVLHNMRSNFELRLAINNVEKLPFISTKKMKAIATEGKTILVNTSAGQKEVADYRGITEDGMYFYNRKYENPYDDSGLTKKFGENDFPKYIRTSDNVALIRLNNPFEDFVYYQKIGMRNYLGGYDVSREALDGSYNLDTYFGPFIVPVPVEDINSTDITTNNEYIQPGMKVIVHSYNNESRDQGKFGIVQAVAKDMMNPDSVKLGIKFSDSNVVSTQEKALMDKFQPMAIAMTERFGIPIEIVRAHNMPMKESATKGMIHNGTMYINADKANGETFLHEIAHPLVKAIMDKNPEWYQKLMLEFVQSDDYKTITQQVKKAYPELSKDEQLVEALVTALGKAAYKQLGDTSNSLMRRLLRSVGRAIKAIIEKLGVFNVDSLSDERASLLSINDLGYILANGKTIKLDLSKYAMEVGTVRSKPDSTVPGEGSVIEDILDAAKLIEDPEVDENGVQSDSYGIRESIGGDIVTAVKRVSSLLGNFSLKRFELVDSNGKPFMSTTEAIVNAEAEYAFKNIPAGELYEEEGIQYTKEEFIKFKNSIYRQWQVKGDLIHALLQYQIAIMNGDTSEQNRMARRVEELEMLSTTAKGGYNWVIEKENFTAIMKNAGINIGANVPVGLKDTVYSEVSVYNADMKVAGKIDSLIVKPSGKLKILDYKTGSRMQKSKLTRMMYYGSQEFDIYDNPVSQAKLQTMIYSVIVKASNPKALFEAPVVMHIPDKYQAKNPRNALQVEVRDYLSMIEQYYKNEEPQAYTKMIANSPRLFNPADYGGTTNTSFTQDLIDKKGNVRDVEMLRRYEIELEQLETSVSIRGMEGTNYKGQWYPSELQKRDKLMFKILQAKSVLGLPKQSSKDYDISKFTMWLGTIHDTHNPYIQAYSQAVDEARAKVYAEYDVVEYEFNSKMTAALEEKLGKRSALEKAFSPVDKKKLFSDLIVTNIKVAEDGHNIATRGLITEADDQWKNLTQAQKDLVIFMRTHMKNIFNEVLVSGPGAVIDEINGVPRTKLSIYNQNAGGNFQMSNSFIPKVGITSSELKFQAISGGVDAIKKYLKHQVAKRLSMFYEENETGDLDKQYGIPIKYIGSSNKPHNPDIHTSNLELAFKTYMQHMINKKYYDSVYALGNSVKGFLQLQTDVHNNPINENSAKFLEYHMTRNLVGKLKDTDDISRKKFKLFTNSNGKNVYFSPMKASRILSSSFAASALWLKVPSATKNAMQAMWAVSKESLVNSLGSTSWGGIDVSKQDLSLKNHSKAYGDWMSYQAASMKGEGKAHPVHVFVKTFRMFPEMSELGYKTRGMVSDGGTVWDVNNLSILYSYPEAMTTAVIAIDAMNSMKIQSGPYAGKSMWEVYRDSVVVDPVSGEGKFELPADFTRGKLRMGDGVTQELRELNFMEIQKLHAVVRRVKGGYRQEERSMIEATALGEMFMLFRRWLPTTILLAAKSKQYDYSIGTLQKTEEEDVYEWQARLTEGKWRTMGGFISNLVMKNQKNGYNWADLSDMQKKNVIDFGITFSTWSMTSALVAAMFGDSDDEDSVRKFASDMNSRLTEQWNPISITKGFVQEPSVVKGVLELLQGLASLGMATAHMATGGDDSNIYTKRGDIKGANQVLKYIPVESAFYDAEKFIDNSEYFSE